MSDSKLRDLERRWRETQAVEDEAAVRQAKPGRRERHDVTSH